MLVHQIETGLHQRQGALTHNLKNTLTAYQSDLTQQLFKDPYHFDFLMIGSTAKERDLENALINHITKVLMELGMVLDLWADNTDWRLAGKNSF
jgi:predicted nuclease of restriction endonuclease-like (RecB) superfamily